MTYDTIFNAVINCWHSIDADRVVLNYDSEKPGKNALDQLHRRISATLDALAAPAAAQEAVTEVLTDEQIVDWFCEEAEFTCGQWQVVIDSENPSFIDAVKEHASRAHGIAAPTQAPQAEPRGVGWERERLREALAGALARVYVCGRVWNAWGWGTMTEDDFEPASNSDELLTSIMDAIAAAQPAAAQEAVAEVFETPSMLGFTLGLRWLGADRCPTGTKLYAAPTQAPQAEPDWQQAVAEAYGYLWHVNNEPMAPIPLYSPEKAAYEARKRLRDLLTSEQRGEAICRIGRDLGRYMDDPEPALAEPRDAGGEDKAYAKRYRWLRSRQPGSTYRIAGVIYSEGGASVDAAIDAAMQQDAARTTTGGDRG